MNKIKSKLHVPFNDYDRQYYMWLDTTGGISGAYKLSILAKVQLREDLRESDDPDKG